MKTLLLCDYRNCDYNEEAPGLARDANGATLIDRQIQALTSYGLKVVCVLAGRHADDQLRQCPSIARVEMAFDDTPESLLGLTSNVKAGLQTAGPEACFVLPVEIPCPGKNIWDFVREGWLQTGKETPYSVIQAADREGAPWHFGFPLLITRHGNVQLMTLDGLSSLADARLKYLHLPFHAAVKLASEAKDL